MDQSQLDALYQQYLGRGVDPSGAATWGNADYNTVVQGILGSQEYQNRQQPQQSAPQQQSGGGTDINSIYQQYLGRGVDPSGAATYAGWDPQRIINAVTSSPEYAQRQGSANGVSPVAPASGNPQELANQVFGAYRTNENYDQALNQLNALPQNADYYRARLGLIGQMMGWQTGQNTGDRNTVYQKELESYLPGAKAAGLSDAEINNLISQNAATASQQNQQRIAQEAAQGQGWVNQNIPGGWATIGGLAALAAAPYAAEFFAPELLGAGTAAEGAGAIGQALPYTEAFDAANLYANGITNAGQLGDILASTGMDPFLAADMGNLAAQGLSAEQIAQVMGYSYTPAELAGTGIASFAPAVASGLSSAAGAAAGAATGSAVGDFAKGALLATALRATGGTNKMLGGSAGFNPYSTASSGLNNNLPGVIRGNENPFVFSKELPVQDIKQASYNPFEALNVKEPIPNLPQNPYVKALQG